MDNTETIMEELNDKRTQRMRARKRELETDLDVRPGDRVYMVERHRHLDYVINPKTIIRIEDSGMHKVLILIDGWGKEIKVKPKAIYKTKRGAIADFNKRMEREIERLNRIIYRKRCYMANISPTDDDPRVKLLYMPMDEDIPEEEFLDRHCTKSD